MAEPFIFSSNSAKEIHIITSDKSLLSSERNVFFFFVFFFSLSFFGSGVFVEKWPKTKLMWNYKQGTLSLGFSSTITSLSTFFESFNIYCIHIRRLLAYLTVFTYSRGTVHLNEAIKLWIVGEDNLALSYKCPFCYHYQFAITYIDTVIQKLHFIFTVFNTVVGPYQENLSGCVLYHFGLSPQEECWAVKLIKQMGYIVEWCHVKRVAVKRWIHYFVHRNPLQTDSFDYVWKFWEGHGIQLCNFQHKLNQKLAAQPMGNTFLVANVVKPEIGGVHSPLDATKSYTLVTLKVTFCDKKKSDKFDVGIR